MKKNVLISLLWTIGLAFTFAQQPTTKSPGTGQTEDPSRRYVALLVGVDAYPYLKQEDQLDYPVKDAEKLKRLLAKYNFKQENIISLPNPTGTVFWRTIDQLKTKVRSVDDLLIFVSLHGKQMNTSGQNDYFWLPTDAKPNKPDSWISVLAFVNKLKQVKYKRLLIILDACYGGSIFTLNPPTPASQQQPIFAGTIVRSRGGPGKPVLVEPSQRQIETLLQLPSSKAITSGTDSQEVPDYSVFFNALYNSLEAYNQQYLLGGSLYYSVYNEVMSKSGTIPVYEIITDLNNTQGADFIFYNPNGLHIRKEPRMMKVVIEKTIVEMTLDVEKGETVRIDATGSIKVGQWVGRVTPDGKDNLDNLPFQIDKNVYNVVPRFPHGALMYRLPPSTQWQYCGERRSFKADKTGELVIEFLVNDKDRDNNDGAFEITGTTVR